MSRSELNLTHAENNGKQVRIFLDAKVPHGLTDSSNTFRINLLNMIKLKFIYTTNRRNAYSNWFVICKIMWMILATSLMVFNLDGNDNIEM